MLGSQEWGEIRLIWFFQSNDLELNVGIRRPDALDESCTLFDLAGSQWTKRMLRDCLLPYEWERHRDLFSRHDEV
jgi:hypothetical protein